MADNFNINTTQAQSETAGGIDPNTGLGIGNSLYSALLKQQSQEQAVQNAQLVNQQQALANKNAAGAAALGINPLTKGFMSKDEAYALIKAQIQRQNLMTPEVQKEIDAWYAAAPDQVEAQDVKDFASKYQPKSTTTHLGQSATFTADQDIQVPNGKSAADIGLQDMHDAAGNSVDDATKSDGQMTAHVPEDGQYQVVTDNEGNIVRVVPGGKTPISPEDKAAAQATAAASKQANADEKSWQKLDAAINTFIKSARGNALSQAVQRSDRALNELAEGQPLTAQVLSFIQKDISGIFQGGVPPESGMESEDFTNILQKVNQIIGKYTGVQGFLHQDLGDQRQYLLGLLNRLRTSTIDMLKKMISSEAAGYQTIISATPDRWQKMVDDKMAAVEGGLSQNANIAITSTNASPAGNLPPATPIAPPSATGETPEQAPASTGNTGWKYIGPMGK